MFLFYTAVKYFFLCLHYFISQDCPFPEDIRKCAGTSGPFAMRSSTTSEKHSHPPPEKLQYYCPSLVRWYSCGALSYRSFTWTNFSIQFLLQVETFPDGQSIADGCEELVAASIPGGTAMDHGPLPQPDILSFSCPRCLKGYPTKAKLSSHTSQAHDWIKCALCNKNVQRKSYPGHLITKEHDRNLYLRMRNKLKRADWEIVSSLYSFEPLLLLSLNFSSHLEFNFCWWFFITKTWIIMSQLNSPDGWVLTNELRTIEASEDTEEYWVSSARVYSRVLSAESRASSKVTY